MLKLSVEPAIRLRGVRHNNLKNFDLDLPLNQLIVITGLSGSGKSSLAFDTLYAEGQRRYIETFSPYARQFFDRMDKPRVDSIEGIPPAIAIEQRNAVKTTRSTVGTMTEICDYMKLLWPQVARLYCRQCGQPVSKDSPQAVWESVREKVSATTAGETNREFLITFDLPLTEKLSLEESLALVSKQGYQRLLLNGEIARIDQAQSDAKRHAKHLTLLTVVQDRIKCAAANRSRFVEACEQAYHFGKGRLAVHVIPQSGRAVSPKPPETGRLDDTVPPTIQNPRLFSNRYHCAPCDIEYREPSPALFSFNHPVGACPACRGFGRTISIDYNLAVPDRTRTLAQGVVKPWQTGLGAECQTDLLRMCRHFGIPTDVPFNRLAQKWQDFVIEGEPGYGKDEEHEWPRAWYGVKGYFRWLESKSYKMHVRVLLSRYRAYTPCPDCHGKRFQSESLLYRCAAEKTPQETHAFTTPARDQNQPLSLADFYQLPIRDSLRFIEALARSRWINSNDPLRLALDEVRSRLGYLDQIGLGYLTLDRPTRTLSGGETERVNLTSCLGTRLVNTLFVLDEPSVGLHPRDTDRLVRLLQYLRDAGNTVVVVEHEASVMRAANQIVDLGPGHGATGGNVVFQGSYKGILKSRESLTGQYLSNSARVEIPRRRPTDCNSSRFLRLRHATRHNLKDLAVDIPLGRFVCLTGVSGSGKTTLAREILLPALETRLSSSPGNRKASERLDLDEQSDKEENESELSPGQPVEIEGAEQLGQVVLVDQSILGKTPRSNPAVYIGAFDDIREFFAQSDLAQQRGLNASAFSFNSAQGQCERCCGAGFEKIEMQFLSDILIRCQDCGGRRYRSHILEVKIRPGDRKFGQLAPISIADLLECTAEEAISFLSGFPQSRPAARAAQSISLLQEVGLGYLQLGQPINTLSGGESQRLKLVRHISQFEQSSATKASAGNPQLRALLLFDEPTTGLHFDDVRVLLQVFQRLVDAGHSVVVIEHNLDVIKSADWIIDLGPEAGDEGGKVVACGSPEMVALDRQSHTGRFLRPLL